MTDVSGAILVAQVLDPIFIQESNSISVSRLGSCLDAIEVRASEDDMIKYSDQNIRQYQVVSRLF